MRVSQVLWISKKRVFELSKGFRGRAKNTIRIARIRVEKALQHATRHRRARAGEVRRNWIQQINAGAREHGLKYSELIHGLKEENIHMNRKMLSDLAINEPYSFKALVDTVKRMKGVPVVTVAGPK
jgi:large subunit ribosomal protein L20